MFSFGEKQEEIFFFFGESFASSQQPAIANKTKQETIFPILE